MMNNTLLFNEVPRPTFRWLQVNHTEGCVWGNDINSGVVTISANKDIITPLADQSLLKDTYTGVNAHVLDAVANHFFEGYTVHVPANHKESIQIDIAVSGKGNASRTRIQLHVDEGAELTVTYYLHGNTEEPSHLQLFTELYAGSQAKVTIKKVQLLGDNVQHFEHRYANYGEQCDVKFINIEVGGQENYYSFDNDLSGKEASLIHDFAYIGNESQKFDISMLMTHIGKATYSDIHTLGALRDTSKKSFRGTLDFLRGSVAAEGAEEDTCLLLDPTVKSVSLPLLLCKEDNVVGNHAASAGQIDQSKLFYLMSRGFSENEAKHIIVESMIRPVIDRIGDKLIEEAALEAVRKKI